MKLIRGFCFFFGTIIVVALVVDIRGKLSEKAEVASAQQAAVGNYDYPQAEVSNSERMQELAKAIKQKSAVVKKATSLEYAKATFPCPGVAKATVVLAGGDFFIGDCDGDGEPDETCTLRRGKLADDIPDSCAWQFLMPKDVRQDATPFGSDGRTLGWTSYPYDSDEAVRIRTLFKQIRPKQPEINAKRPK